MADHEAAQQLLEAARDENDCTDALSALLSRGVNPNARNAIIGWFALGGAARDGTHVNGQTKQGALR